MKRCKHPFFLVLLVIFRHQHITDGYCLSMSSEIQTQYNDNYICCHFIIISFYFSWKA